MNLAPAFTTKVNFNNGRNADIITVIHDNIEQAEKEASIFSFKFKDSDRTKQARNIWQFLRRLKYIKDDEGQQNVKLPKRLMYEGGDCKSFALITAAILKNLKQPFSFRYASYDRNNLTPSHVYVTTNDERGKEIIIDGVYKHFNAEVPYTKKYDYKMKITTMNGISIFRGENQQVNRSRSKVMNYEKALTKVPAGGFIFTVLTNQINKKNNERVNVRYSKMDLENYAEKLKNKINAEHSAYVNNLFTIELNDVLNGSFKGMIPLAHLHKFNKEHQESIRGIAQEYLNGFEYDESIGRFRLRLKDFNLKNTLKKVSIKNIAKAIKKVSFIPNRRAFLTLVQLNFRGLAARMASIERNKIHNVWRAFGGDTDVIDRTIESGKRKKPVFGGGRVNGIGVEPVTTGTAVAIIAAIPLLAAIVKILGKRKNGPEPGATDGTTLEEVTADTGQSRAGGDVVNKIKDFAEQAIETGQKFGIIPERSLTPEEQAVTKSTQDIEHSGGGIPKIAIVAGLAIGAYLLLGKKSSTPK